MDINKNLITKMRDVVYQNLMESYLPFPLDTKLYSSWAKELPVGGDTIIYTSYMYQISSILKKYESMFPKIYRLNIPRKLMNASKFIIKPSESEIQRSFLIINNIVQLLHSNGIKFGYLYDDEPYSGALLLESGFLNEFKSYGEKLHAYFKERGVKHIITIDPHTTNSLKRLSEMIDFDIDVKNYLEIVDFSGSGEYVIHDSCLYSRSMGMYDYLRKKIEMSGIIAKEDYLITSKEMGSCCGGPLSLVSVSDSNDVASERAKKLLSVNSSVIVMCPLCYQNLAPYVNDIKDIAEVISPATGH
ncbi:MAG: (Fe-S)-binding protein [Ferroplasma sp.]